MSPGIIAELQIVNVKHDDEAAVQTGPMLFHILIVKHPAKDTRQRVMQRKLLIALGIPSPLDQSLGIHNRIVAHRNSVYQQGHDSVNGTSGSIGVHVDTHVGDGAQQADHTACKSDLKLSGKPFAKQLPENQVQHQEGHRDHHKMADEQGPPKVSSTGKLEKDNCNRQHTAHRPYHVQDLLLGRFELVPQK